MNVLQNLETLLAAVQAQPEGQFNLSSYKKETECGTLFCTAGLAATLPEFEAMGFAFKPISYDGSRFAVTVDGIDIDENPKTDEIFGPYAWPRLFAPYSGGTFDDEEKLHSKTANGNIDWDSELVSHKELAIDRLKQQIKRVKGEA